MRTYPSMLSTIGVLVLWACGTTSQPTVTRAQLAGGVYSVTYGGGFVASDGVSILATTARLDRTAGTLLLYVGDGSQRTLTVSPRAESVWPRDCFTMAGYALDEVADLAPAPLSVGALNFVSPIIYAKCSPNRMILADRFGDDTKFIAFDLQP